MSDFTSVEVYHVTSERNLPSVKAQGVKPVSYWTNDTDVLDYYISTIEDEGEEPVVLTARLGSFNAAALEPDYPGIEEPLSFTLKRTEEDIWDAWQHGDKTWKDSLELVGSVRYKEVLPMNRMFIETGNTSLRGAGSMITSNGKLLLLRRSSSVERPGLWNLPGGHIEEGETAKEACLRETYEETGILPFVEAIPGVVILEAFAVFPWEVSAEMDPDLNEEHDAYGWFTPEEVGALDTIQGMDSVVEYWINHNGNQTEVRLV